MIDPKLDTFGSTDVSEPICTRLARSRSVYRHSVVSHREDDLVLDTVQSLRLTLDVEILQTLSTQTFTRCLYADDTFVYCRVSEQTRLAEDMGKAIPQ